MMIPEWRGRSAPPPSGVRDFDRAGRIDCAGNVLIGERMSAMPLDGRKTRATVFKRAS